MWVEDADAAIAVLREELLDGDIVLIKASRGVGLERVAAALTDQTRHSFNEARFHLMKPGAYLVNVARGPVVDTDSLVAALNSERIAGAAVDVTEPEPLPDGHPLWSAKNIIITIQ